MAALDRVATKRGTTVEPEVFENSNPELWWFQNDDPVSVEKL